MYRHFCQLLRLIPVFSTVMFAHAQSITVQNFPGATLLDFSDDQTEVSYDFITGPADKIKRDVIIENSVRVTGRVFRSTYALPSGTKREEVFAHYQDQLQRLNAQTIFACDGPDCGRSTTWASQIFKRRDLSAPIRNQSYSASVVDGGSEQNLFAVYVVARGNLRVMAHVEQIVLSSPVSFDTNQSLEDELIRRGVVMLKEVTPSLTGGITTNDLKIIVESIQELSLLSTHEIYVVCHIHGSRPTPSLVDASSKCAQSIVTAISEETDLTASAFGAGPLIPLEDRPLTRIELVVPALVRRE